MSKASSPKPRQGITILGSTGSIGTQTLDIARWRNFNVVGLAAGNNIELLAAQAQEFKPRYVSCHDDKVAALRPLLPTGTEIVSVAEVARAESDVVVAAIAGMAGLKPTLAAIEAGRAIALANKEAMVVAGPLMWQAAEAQGVPILPVDSEHSALFQCLQGESLADVAELILTASGGPFRLEPADLSKVQPKQALKHPNWLMGAKVTIDSATLFNKGLEVLEAHFLFDMPLDAIKVLVHPQSLVHGLVRFHDGSLKAQVGAHDMRLPIQYALTYPERPTMPLEPLDLVGNWEFHQPDTTRFPALELAYEAGRRGGTAPTALNAADEIAVAAFLAGKIKFSDIPRIIEKVLETVKVQPLAWDVLELVDEEARGVARGCISRL